MSAPASSPPSSSPSPAQPASLARAASSALPPPEDLSQSVAGEEDPGAAMDVAQAVAARSRAGAAGAGAGTGSQIGRVSREAGKFPRCGGSGKLGQGGACPACGGTGCVAAEGGGAA
jgi:hypothetical protein